MNKWENPKIENLKLMDTKVVCSKHYPVLVEESQSASGPKATWKCSGCDFTGDWDAVHDHIGTDHHGENICQEQIS